MDWGGSLSLLQGIFPLNPGLPHCRWILHQLSYHGRPKMTQNWDFIFPVRVGPYSYGITVWEPQLKVLGIYKQLFFVVAVQSLSHVWLFATPWTIAHEDSLYFTISWSLLKLMSSESVMPSNHLILCHPRLLLPSIFPSIRVFSNKSALHISWPKYWSFSFSPSSEYSRLISFRIDWFDLLDVQGTQVGSQF